MIELEQVGKFIQKNCTWLCNDDLLDSHLVEEINNNNNNKKIHKKNQINTSTVWCCKSQYRFAKI